jgi:hypothetical protein
MNLQRLFVLLALAALAPLDGCVSVMSSHQFGVAGAVNDGWYVKNNKDVYYCDGQTNICKKAEIR